MGYTANTSSMTTDFYETYPEANLVSGQTRRRRRVWTTVMLVAGMLGLYFVVTRTPAGPEGWGSNFNAAMAEAGTSGKNVVLDFYLDGCPPCEAMDKFVLSTHEVRSALAGMIPVRLNGAKHREVARRYNVMATPTYIVVNPAGESLARTEGYMSTDEFIAFLNAAKTAIPAGPSSAARAPNAP